jgi:REP element-mobilizing transposase RayT
MDIRKRKGYPRSFFHVMNRGARKVSIFADGVDRKIFRGLLARFAEKYDVPILGWCLMPNHYHLQPDTDGTSLSEMMRDLDATYARSFNERHGSEGCLFQGPFKSMLIQEMDGLAYVNRYLHLNPVDLHQSPGEYAWSSCRVYLGVEAQPPWMALEPVMSAIRKPGMSDAESYAYYLQAGLTGRRKKTRPHNDEIGDFYSEWIRHLEEKVIEETVGMEDLFRLLSLSTLVTWVAHCAYEVPAQYLAEFYEYAGAATVRSICSRVQRRLDEDPALRAALGSLHGVHVPPTRKR